MSRKSVIFLFAIFLIYLLSAGVRILFPVEDKTHKHQVNETIEWKGSAIQFSYLEYGASNSTNDIPVIINTDPFNSLSILEPFVATLAENRRVIIPVYPTHTVDDERNRISHSPGSRAEMLSTFLEHNSIQSVDLAGHGFGNAVSIEFLMENAEGAARSYTMLSSLGVQEFHFLGYHILNQPIYSLLYPVGWLIDYGLPVANWKRFSNIDFEGVRFLNNLDQRPYREFLEEIQLPVLIVHSTEDRHVSVNTADEHYRIIPQSEKVIFEGGHHSIFEEGEKWANVYESFLNEIENGNAIVADGASSIRKKAAERDFKFGDVPPVDGWGFILVIILLSGVTLVSEDLGCIGSGLLAAGNVIPVWVAFLVVYIGILIADSGIYWIGRILGRPVLNKAPVKWFVSKRDIDWSESLFRTNGFKIIFISRFVPGSRFPTYFTAGVLKTRFSLFLLYFIISISIWTPLLLGISILVGQQMLVYLQIYQEYALEIFFGLLIILYIAIKYLLPLVTRKGRREFVVKIIRLKQRFTS